MKTSLLIIIGITIVSLLIHVDQSYAITNLIDEAKEKGLPYLTSVQVKEDVLKIDDTSLLILQVDFHSKNNTDIWIDIKPVVENQFISYHKAGFSTASGVTEPYGGEVKNQHRIQDYVEYDDSVIRLNSNESKQIPVYVKVPVEYLGKFQNNPLPILVGFELIDSNVLEKLPRDLEKLEIKFEPSFQDSITSPLKQFKSGISFDKIQCKDNLELIQKYDGSPACVTESTKQKLVEMGWTKDGSALSKINTGCMTIEQSKQIASFFKTPTYLPDGYSHVCSRSGMPFESYIVYYNQEFPNNWQIPELVNEGAIFIYQIDERNFVGAEKFETFGTAEQRIQETYDSIMDGNPSLNPQLIIINDILAYAVDSCSDCGMQTANFTDGTFIQKSTSTKTKIKFIDENGIKYMLETSLPLQELIKVTESLQ